MQTELEQKLGYTYRDRALFERALAHSSYANERGTGQSYERLEFLGDSILGFVTADHLYRNFPEKQEGELTRIRAELVCQNNLAAVARSIGLGEYLLLGHGEVQTGGRERPGILCDVMESLIAAAYLDGGIHAARGIVERLVLPRLSLLRAPRDHKTELQELVQRKRDQVLSYTLIDENGPPHCREFVVQVSLNGVPVGNGVGTSKKRAEQAAAAEAIARLFPNEP